MKFSELFQKIRSKLVMANSNLLEEGDDVPEFSAVDQDGERVESEEIGYALIYFYPHSGTPGCTKQACELRDGISRLEELEIDVYGVSVESVESQKSFEENNNLNFGLLADESGDVSRKFGVLTKAGFPERTSFIVRDGKIEKVFRRVDYSEHLETIMDYLSTGE